MSESENDWFKTWFNSPYYPLLYKHRDDKEAQLFIDKLIEHLKLSPQAAIEDVCCGRGRHSVYLNKKGFNVTGIDISEEAINEARSHANETLCFFVHDMREPFKTNYFDAAFNLFTSFGYFNNNDEEIKALKSITTGLKKNGILVIDYFNSEKVIEETAITEIKNINDILFKINKKIKENIAVKTIEIDDKGKKSVFCEKVKLFTLNDFEKMLNDAGLKLISTFGDYNLSPYNKTSSERLILTAIKK